MIGKMEWLTDAGGYGLIRSSDGPDVFVHRTAIAGERRITLNEGDVVEFELVQGPHGPQAATVIVRPKKSALPQLEEYESVVVAAQTSPHPEALSAGEIRPQLPRGLGRIETQVVSVTLAVHDNCPTSTTPVFFLGYI
jgi:cold shock protein